GDLLRPRDARRQAAADDQPREPRSALRPRLRPAHITRQAGRHLDVELHGLRRAQRVAGHRAWGRGQADPKKLRADANALGTELLTRLRSDEVHELEVRRGGVRVRVSKEGGTQTAVAPAAAGPVVVGAPAAPDKTDYATVNAPLTGIFYRSASPQAP